MSPLELVDDRFEKLAAELRAARPVVSEGLRERVQAFAPPPPPRLTLDVRRFAPAAGFAVLAASLGVAAVLGIVHGGSGPRATSAAPAERTVRGVQHGSANSWKSAGSTALKSQNLAPRGDPAQAFDFSTNRLQQYDASLRVRVPSQDELSRRTQEALQLTRRLGGYVVTAKYSAPGKVGTSSLALRIPIQNVQAAIAQFSGYGTLVSQRIELKDLQQHVDALTARIRRLRAEIARLEQAGAPQAKIDFAKRLLLAAANRKAASVHRAQLASLALTMAVGTKAKPAAAAPGRFRRTLDDAWSVLVREGELLLYALLVAGPLLLLGGAGIVAGRSLRRRSDRRLLERA